MATMSSALPPSADPSTLGSIPRTGWFNLAWSVGIAVFLWAVELAAPGAGPSHGLVVYLVHAISLGYWCWTLVGIVLLAEARHVWQRQPARRPRYLQRGVYGLVRWPTVLLCALVCVPLACVLGIFMAEAMLRLPWPDALVEEHRLSWRISLVLSFSIALLTFTLDSLRVRLAANEVRAQEAQRQALESQLQLLRAQLDPHMMFNTLANLHALIDADPQRAQDMLDRLIAFLRATLNGSRTATHSLREEFNRLQDYLALMQIRMGSRLQVHIDLPTGLHAVNVPTLLLQPLVENAIKHGLEPSRTGGRLSVQAEQRGDELWLEVHNTGCQLPPDDTLVERSGFGTESVRQRLRSAYGEGAVLDLQTLSQGGTRVLVRIPLSRPPIEAPTPPPASPFGPSSHLP